MFELKWQPPYDWAWMLGFLAPRTVAGVEQVSAQGYQRSFALEGLQGLITVELDQPACRLMVTLSPGLMPVADQVLARLSRFFDLDCNTASLLAHLGPLAQPRPGIRLPGCMDPFEQVIRAVLGQLVSVAMAAKLAGYVTREFGEALVDKPGWKLFPTAERLAQLQPGQLKALGMPLKRGEAIIHIAREHLAGRFPAAAPENVEQGIKALMTWPGIGRWTASYFALRGWQARDIFLPDDYLIKQRFPGMTPAQIRRYAERWQPWRSYALLHIWYTDGWQPDQLIAK